MLRIRIKNGCTNFDKIDRYDEEFQHFNVVFVNSKRLKI